jgi:hypothetical protein
MSKDDRTFLWAYGTDGYGCRAFVTRDDSLRVCNAGNTAMEEQPGRITVSNPTYTPCNLQLSAVVALEWDNFSSSFHPRCKRGGSRHALQTRDSRNHLIRGTRQTRGYRLYWR